MGEMSLHRPFNPPMKGGKKKEENQIVTLLTVNPPSSIPSGALPRCARAWLEEQQEPETTSDWHDGQALSSGV